MYKHGLKWPVDGPRNSSVIDFTARRRYERVVRACLIRRAPYFTDAINGKCPPGVLLAMNFFCLVVVARARPLVKSEGGLLRDAVRKCRRFVEHNRLSEGEFNAISQSPIAVA